MIEPLTTIEIITRLGTALACGGLLGWERELRDKPAGLRTHMMVALGSASFTLVTFQIYQSMLLTSEGRSPFDPTRVIQGVVGGIGFLGAGTIIQSRGSVQGVTTSAAIWVMGAIGVACGAGAFKIALITVVLAFVILAAVGVLNRLEHFLGLGGHSKQAGGEPQPQTESPQTPAPHQS